MIAFHFIQLKLLLALGADSLLPLVCFPLHIVGERTDVQVSFIPIKHIRIDSRFLLYVVVLHQPCDVLLQLVCIKVFVLELIVETPPIDPLHLSPIIRKRRFRPPDDFLKVLPQRRRVLVVLMLRHVLFDLTVRAPFNRSFQVFLSDRATSQIGAGQPIGRTASLAEVSLSIRSPRTRVNGITQFLFGVFLAGDVDSSESIQLFAISPGAEINHQFITKNLLLLIVLQVVKR